MRLKVITSTTYKVKHRLRNMRLVSTGCCYDKLPEKEDHIKVKKKFLQVSV